MANWFNEDKTVRSTHYALGYYLNGSIYLVHLADGQEIGMMVHQWIMHDFYKYQREITGKWSEYKLPCEKLHELWVNNRESILEGLKKIGKGLSDWNGGSLSGLTPSEDREEVRELFDRFFEMLAVDFYDSVEKGYDFQVWQKGVEKEAIKNAKTKKARKYHEFVYSTLY